MRSHIQFALTVAVVAGFFSTGAFAVAPKKPGGPPPGVIYIKHDNTQFKLQLR